MSFVETLLPPFKLAGPARNARALNRSLWFAAALTLLAISFGLVCNLADAANGTWVQDSAAPQNWSNASNWIPGIADGTGSIADFSTLNIVNNNTVVVDSARTVGQLLFQDKTTASNDWTLTNSGGAVLTLDNGASVPVIDVLNRTLTISGLLGGTNGFQKIDAGALILSGNNTGLSGTVTLKRGDVTVQSNNALGTGTVIIDPGTSLNTRLLIATGGLNLPNAITMNSSNSGGGVNGSILVSTATDVTLSGAITINAVATSGGHFAESSTGFINLTGPVTDTLPVNFVSGGAGNGIVIRSGNTRWSGGGSAFRIDNRSGTIAVGADNGIPTNAFLNLGGNGNGTLDLAGHAQTLVGVAALIGANTNTITSSSTTAVSTLTFAPNPSSYVIPQYTNLSFGGVVSDSSSHVSIEHCR